MDKRFSRMLVLVAVLWLVSCGGGSFEEGALEGRILVWHDWRGAEAEVLDELFERFNDVYPGVRILPSAMALDEDDLHEEFITHTKSGLGPDLLIFRASSIPEFADLGLIHDLSSRDDLDMSYVSSEVGGLEYKGKVYGLPFSLSTNVLYYNKHMVTNPPETLAELLKQSYNGQQVALDSTFEGAFWGLKGFGGQLFDDQGRVVLNQGGFANWLGWLKNAQSVPSIILSNNKQTLYDLFVNKQVAYYVGSSDELARLQQGLGENVVQVAPLPAGPIDKAGPLLQVDALMFSRASDSEEIELALELAKFLTNVEQQTTLAMKEIGRLPTNSRVTLDERVSPIAAAFAKQSKTGVTIALPNMPKVNQVVSAGNEIYTQVLAGVKDRNDAITQLTEQVNSQYGFDRTNMLAPFSCLSGRIGVRHSFREADAAVLDQIRRNFMQLCPQATIDLMPADPDPTFRYLQYRDEVAQRTGPDLLIDSTNLELFSLMVGDELLRDISDLVAPEFLQRYVPRAQEAMRYKGNLYGLPLSMELMALYYKSDLVSEPPSTLDDLLKQADPKQQVALPLAFEQIYWGVPAFGGQLLDEKNRLILHQGGFIEWLLWLREARKQSGVVLSNDPDELRALFVEGDAAYLAGENKLLTQLQDALGPERVGVTPLPAGARGPAGPILTVEGVMLNPTSNQEQAALAFEFAKYLTSAQSQQLLLSQTKRVPANVNVTLGVTTDDLAIAAFLEQAKTATVPPNVREIDALWQQAAYLNIDDLITRETNLVEEIDNFNNSVNNYNRFVLNAQKPSLTCEGQGEVLLWHSWHPEEVKALVLEQLMADFTDSCPQIQVKSLFVPANEIPTQLLTAGVQQPDFFLAPHDLVVPLSRDGLIKAIPPLADRAHLGEFEPWAISALENNDLLYGLPLTGDIMGLYYNTDLVEQVPQTVDDFLAAASVDTPLAFDSSFYGAYWGLSAFGGPLFDQPEPATLDPNPFIAWFTWLQRANDHSALLFSPDQQSLQARFATGEAAYLVAGADALTSLSLGGEPFRVTTLPAGPAGKAQPLLRVQAFLFTATAPEEQTLLARQFAQFATSVYSQKQLMEKANLVPINFEVQVDLNSPINHFINSAREGIHLPPRTQTQTTIITASDTAYQNLLQHAQNPTQAVHHMLKLINQQPQQ